MNQRPFVTIQKKGSIGKYTGNETQTVHRIMWCGCELPSTRKNLLIIVVKFDGPNFIRWDWFKQRTALD